MRRWNSMQLMESLQQQQQQQQQQYQEQHHHQQGSQPPGQLTAEEISSSSTSATATAAFRRLLSLQRPSSRSRQCAAAIAVTPLDLSPPPLPPPRATRHASGSEFSAVVLDVSRLYSDSGYPGPAGFDRVRGDEDDLQEDQRRPVFSTGSSDGGAETVDDEEDEEEDEEEVDPVAAAAAREAREAAVEIEEAEDVYMEIPLRTTASTAAAASVAAVPHAFGRRAVVSLQRSASSHVAVSPSRALLDTLEALKTPTIPDSDPDSPVYTTDCGGDDRPPHLPPAAGSCQQLRNASSLMLSSAGEEGGSYAGVARLDSARIGGMAGSHHLLSAPELSHYPQSSAGPSRRVSQQSRRQSIISLQQQHHHQSATAVRKASRASRAVKLDYQFASSSGKASLQKIGGQSLARLEDLAQIGSTEQGTNYKRSYVSLYRPLYPLFVTLKIFGAFHTRQSGGRAAAKFTRSYIYSGLVMLALWLNVLRYLAVYDWRQERFGSTLFLKLTHHVIYFQAAVASTVMFRASGSFPRFFKACHEFMSRRHNLTYQYTLRTRAKATAMLGLAVVLLELGVLLSWMVQADVEYFNTFLRPYTYLVPWRDATKGILGFCTFAFNVYLAAAWVFPALLFCSFTWIFEREFRFLAHRLRLACTNDHIFVGDIEKFRLESWKISKLVARFDALFNFYVFTVFITDILNVCLILYNVIAAGSSFPSDGIIVEVWFWLVSALVRLFGVTISAARVNQAACSPLNVIQNMNLRDYAVNPAKIGQLMIFLNKLTIGNIGFTAWNLFTLSRTTTMTIAAMIVTYTVLFVKLGASYGENNRLSSTNTAAAATSAATDPLLATAATGF